MATAFSDVIFVACAIAIAVSQWFILRSTGRGMRYADAHPDGAGQNRAALEWLYAIVPALALVAMLGFSWRAMHPGTVRAKGIIPSSIGADS